MENLCSFCRDRGNCVGETLIYAFQVNPQVRLRDRFSLTASAAQSFWEKPKSLRRVTAVLHITTEISGSKPPQGTTAKRKHSLNLLERLKTWINSLLEWERDEFLSRGVCR
jgi:hypothetical protein